jgi:pimeloyl-ACP methyl ester carboxylesterase
MASTILFLHGALGTSQDVRPLMDLLEQKGHKALSFDFSGHGANAPWPSEFRIDLFSRDLEAYFASHKLKEVVVFGHDIGGYTALYHKVNHENSPVVRIFTYGTKFNWKEQSVAKELPLLNPEHLQEKFPESANSLKAKHGDRWKSILLSTAHMYQNLERLDGLTREDFSDLDIPVTLMIGDQDRSVSTEETNLARSWIPHAELKTISHSKHDLERANLKEISHVLNEGLHF